MCCDAGQHAGKQSHQIVNVLSDDDNVLIDLELARASRNVLDYTMLIDESSEAHVGDDGDGGDGDSGGGGGGGDGDSGGGGYVVLVRRVLGLLVRNGCTLARLDNHWDCGVGGLQRAQDANITDHPPHWNALHASIFCPDVGASAPGAQPDSTGGSVGPSDGVWLRLHFHTTSSHGVQEAWLSKVQKRMGMVIHTTEFNDHRQLSKVLRQVGALHRFPQRSKWRWAEAGWGNLKRVGPCQDDDLVVDEYWAAARIAPRGASKLGIGAHEQPRPTRLERVARIGEQQQLVLAFVCLPGCYNRAVPTRDPTCPRAKDGRLTKFVAPWHNAVPQRARGGFRAGAGLRAARGAPADHRPRR